VAIDDFSSVLHVLRWKVLTPEVVTDSFSTDKKMLKSATNKSKHFNHSSRSWWFLSVL